MTAPTARLSFRWYTLSTRSTMLLLQVVLWGLLGGFYFAWYNRVNLHFSGPRWSLVLLEMGFAIILFNSLVYLIIPRWLMRGHYWRALAGGIALLYGYRVWKYIGARLAEAYLPLSPDLRTFFDQYYIAHFRDDLAGGGGMLNTFIGMMATMLFPLVISFLAYALVVDRRRQALERDHLRLELSYLKTQINPQFLFNTLHSLHGLTRTRDARAGDVVLHLADLMRYTLYETDAERVPLGRELEFMSDYLALERLRSPDTIAISHRVTGEVTTQQLAPLLLHPFLEGLFAGLDAVPASTVAICSTVQVAAEEVTLTLSRTATPPPPRSYPTEAAVVTALRHLQLQYPGRHTVDLTDADGRVDLRIRISLS